MKIAWVLAFLSLSAIACDGDSQQADPSVLGSGGEVESGGGEHDLDVSGSGDTADGTGPEAALAGISTEEDPDGLPACEAPAECVEGYESFLEHALAYGQPRDLSALPTLLRSIDAGSVAQSQPRLDANQMREQVVTALGIGFLLPDISRRTLEVRVLSELDRGGYIETTLVLRDPWVGAFDALLLQPKQTSRRAAVLAVHGHGDTKEVYRDAYHGYEHAERGYTVLILGLRAMGSGPSAITEHLITRKLYAAGFSLMGMRVYESLLGLKYLRSLATVDPKKVLLIGHSGGSSTGNLTVRVEPSFAGYVSDHQVDYAEWVAGLNVYHCETVPSLFPYSEQINDPTDSPVPTLKVPYKYTDGMSDIFAFFDARTGQ